MFSFKRNQGTISVKKELETFFKKNNITSKGEVDKENGTTSYTFTYQGGYFVAEVDSDDSFVNVYYPSFKEVNTNHINEVRAACNNYNQNVKVLKFSYSIDDNGNTAHMHIAFSDDRIDDKSFTNKLAACFHYHRVISQWIDDSIKDTSNDGNDWETRFAKSKHKDYLIEEGEIKAQHGAPFTYRENDTIKFTLKLFLYTTFDLQDVIYKSLTLSNSQGMKVLTDHNDITLTSLPSLIVSDDASSWTSECATATLAYTMPHDDTVRHISICVTQAGHDSISHYVRITATLVPDSTGPTHQRNQVPRSTTVLTAVDKTSPKKKMDEVDYMWKETKIKHRDGEPLTDEQYFLWTIENVNLAYNYYWGMRHFNEERYYDAILHLENLFFKLKPNFYAEDGHYQELFYEVCYHLGFCYLEIWNPIRAFYFLDIAIASGNITHVMEHINVLANTGDVRGLASIDRLWQNVQEMLKNDNDADVEKWNNLLEFLKRRKGFLLIEFNMLDEAEEIFTSLLDHPNSHDYAINELAHIKRLRQEQGNQ